MFRNYFSQSIRTLFRNRLISFINLFGLSVSLTLLTLLFAYLKFEYSYDKFHDKQDRISRILTKIVKPGEEAELHALCQGHLPDVIADIPGIDKTLRVYRSHCDLESDNKRWTNNPVIYADSTFFEIFSFKILRGNTAYVLRDPDGIVLCRSIATKIFNSIDILGKTIKCNDKYYRVEAVMEDVPSNSHLQFEVLCSLKGPLLRNMVEHSGLEFLTYILLKENVSNKSVFDKISEEYGKYLSEFWKESGFTYGAVIQKLTDIELHSGNIIWDVQHANINNILLATGLIGFIILVAVLNFINLETVSAEIRLKEIAVRKISGANQLDMIRRYMGETIFTAIISGLVAILLLAGFSWPVINSFTGKEITENLLFNPEVISCVLILCVIIGITAGIYPAIHLSKIPIIKVMKNSSSKGLRTNPFIKILVFAQFSIVIFLVSGLVIFYRQIEFIKDKDLGFNKEYVVAVNGLTPSVCRSYKSIRQELLREGVIDNVCLSQGINVSDLSGQYATAVGSGKDPILVRHTRTMHGFVNTFRLELLEGRDFDSTMSTDYKNYLINETAAKSLGFTGDPVGKPLVMNDTGLVIGVVKDFNFASLHNRIEPLIITLNELRRGYIFVRLKSSHVNDGLSIITNKIRSVDPMYSPDYEFVDDRFNSMYMDEAKMSKALFICTLISILLAFMGLVALTSFTILRRVKEIGIRKINGAETSEVLFMLNKEYAVLVVQSFFVATPISWLVMHKWLSGFAYRTEVPWWVFILSGFFALMVSFISVSIICWKEANRNPVETLKYE